MKVILISGRSGVGKDTFAKELKNQLIEKGYNAIISHNANPAILVTRKYFGIRDYKTKIGKKIIMGVTELLYDIDQFMFEKIMMEILYENEYTYKRKIDYLIIPDWRYENTYFYHMKNAFTLFLKRDSDLYSIGEEAQEKENKLLKKLNPFIQKKIELKGEDYLKQQVKDYIKWELHII